MSQMRVNTRQIRAKASELRVQNSKLYNQIERLTSTESALNGMWDGEAHDSFHRRFTRDVKKMNSFHTLVQEYVQTLEEIASDYEQMERKNCSRYS